MTATAILIATVTAGAVLALGWLAAIALERWSQRRGPAVHPDMIEAQRAIARFNVRAGSITRRWRAGK